MFGTLLEKAERDRAFPGPLSEGILAKCYSGPPGTPGNALEQRTSHSMKENRYDDLEFFEKYRQMPRSVDGLSAAGEWHAFRRMLPDLSNKRVLDLGCGFGWHCQYAISQGAQSVVGVDISERMLSQARKRSPTSPSITYLRLAIEDIEFPKDSFDVVISSLAFHYLELLREVYSKVHDCLLHDGDFIFSAKHPVFTSNDRRDWCYEKQTRLHWPVDNDYHEGLRKTRFLEEDDSPCIGSGYRGNDA